jgi:hypothetical protein
MSRERDDDSDSLKRPHRAEHGAPRTDAALFRCPILFDHSRNELELDPATLRLPQRAADDWLRVLVDDQAQGLLERVGERTRLAARAPLR